MHLFHLQLAYATWLQSYFILSTMAKAEAEVESKPAQSGSDIPDDVSEGAVQQAASGEVMDDGVRRALKSRHLQMIALGGVIGPGVSTS